MHEFLIYAVLVGISSAVSMCPTGCIILWRRLPYFGDAIAHSAIFGVVLGLILNINITISVIIISILFSFLLYYWRKEKTQDIFIVIFSYAFLSLGLFLLAFANTNAQIDIFSYLFGDILLVSLSEVILVVFCSSIIVLWLFYRWKNLLLMSINEDLAFVDGVNVRKIDLEFLMIVAFLVGSSIKILGALLVASMLVIPAAAARNFSNSAPEMLLRSMIIGSLSVISGLALSYFIDSASGPSIILSAVVIFILSLALKSNNT